MKADHGIQKRRTYLGSRWILGWMVAAAMVPALFAAGVTSASSRARRLVRPGIQRDIARALAAAIVKFLTGK